MKFGGGLLEPMVGDLNPAEQMEFDMAELAMGQAKKTALPALENDAFEIMDFFETLTDREDNHFTGADVLDALESYEDRVITYPREKIQEVDSMSALLNNPKNAKLLKKKK